MKHTAVMVTFLCPVCCCLTPEQRILSSISITSSRMVIPSRVRICRFSGVTLLVLPISCHCRALWRLLFLHSHFHSLGLEPWEEPISRVLANQLKVLHRGDAGPRLTPVFGRALSLVSLICPWIPQWQQGSVHFPHVVTICSSVNIFKFYSAQ